MFISCKENTTNSDLEHEIKNLDQVNDLKLIQTDDRFGEWGGNTFVLRIYKDHNQKTFMADYEEFAGSKEPPPPPKTDKVNDSMKVWYEHKPMVMEKKGIKLPAEKITALLAIAETLPTS